MPIDAISSTRTSSSHIYGGGATAHLEIETEHDRDAKAVREKNLELNAKGEVADGVYRGLAGTKNFIQKTADQLSANKFTGTQGMHTCRLYASISSHLEA